jgi:hypothetical protein
MRAERWEAALDRVLELTVLLGRDMADSLAREGLTDSRAHLLWQLQQRGPCTQRTLAADLHVTPRAITALVDGLVATGFVTREPHPSDRRDTGHLHRARTHYRPGTPRRSPPARAPAVRRLAR